VLSLRRPRLVIQLKPSGFIRVFPGPSKAKSLAGSRHLQSVHRCLRPEVDVLSVQIRVGNLYNEARTIQPKLKHQEIYVTPDIAVEMWE